MIKTTNRFQLRIRVAGGSRLPAEWHWEPEPFTDYDLWLCRGGTGVVETENRQINFSRGDCFLFQPGVPYRIWETKSEKTSNSERGLLHYFVHFNFTGATNKPRKPSKCEKLKLYRHLRRFSFLENIIGNVVQIRREKQPGWEVESDLWFRTALFEIDRDDAQSTLSGRELEHHRNIESICTIILDDPGRSFRLPELAAEYHYSTEHLTRVFKQLKGVSPGEFIIASRMNAAKDLLLFSSLSIKEIAFSLSYCDVYFFSKQFRQRIGYPPKKYRSMHL